MGITAEDRTVEREIVIAAPPERVWELLVDERQALCWMGITASFDARRGGRYRVEVIPGQVASGEFLEIDPPRRLVYTWGWEPGSRSPVAAGSTTVVFELQPHGKGTRLRLTHRDLPSREAAESHAHGWEHYLERLRRVASGSDPGPDPWISGGMR